MTFSKTLAISEVRKNSGAGLPPEESLPEWPVSVYSTECTDRPEKVTRCSVGTLIATERSENGQGEFKRFTLDVKENKSFRG